MTKIYYKLWQVLQSETKFIKKYDAAKMSKMITTSQIYFHRGTEVKYTNKRFQLHQISCFKMYVLVLPLDYFPKLQREMINICIGVINNIIQHIVSNKQTKRFQLICNFSGRPTRSWLMSQNVSIWFSTRLVLFYRVPVHSKLSF